MHRDCPRGSVLEDETTGDLVCRNCCLVLGQIYMDTTPAPPRRVGFAVSTYPMKAVEYQARETIMNVCSHLNLDTTCLVDSALFIWRELSERDSRPARFLSMTSTKCRARLAYAIMEALNRQCTPRSPELICQTCDVTVGDMLKLEGVCGNVMTYCDPHHYVDTACAVLELPFWLTKLVVQLAMTTQKSHFGFKPEPLVAACIWSVVCKVAKESGQSVKMTSDKIICDLLGVSKRSMLAWLKRLPKYGLRRSAASVAAAVAKGGRPFQFVEESWDEEMGSDGEGGHDTLETVV